jgi:4-hydroxyacetophenone monooxygenase
MVTINMSPRTTRPTDEAGWRRLLSSAEPIVLRVALYQMTGLSELADMRVERRPTRGGSSWQPVLSEEHRARLIDLAVDHLSHRDANDCRGSKPDLDEVKELVALLTGTDVSEDAAHFAFDELAFEDVPRGVDWPTTSRPSRADQFHVTIVGSGISGIIAAIHLDRLGIPFTILERDEDIGGTWLRNSYPEARVDVSSFLYQYKIAKGYEWGHYYAPRDEVMDYLRHVVERFDIRRHIEFASEVTALRWDGPTASWLVTVRDARGERTIRSNVVFNACGLFNKTFEPQFEGMAEYRGCVFHTTHWDHSLDPTGKRVGLIGNGSTGTQVMPALARRAGHVTAFQRSAKWILPVPDYRDPIPSELHQLFAHVPNYWNWYCFWIYVSAANSQGAQIRDDRWIEHGGHFSERNDALRTTLTRFIHETLAGRPDLIEKSLPSYPPFAKRMILDNGWYDALLRDNVDLVTEPIERFTEHGILTRDGTLHVLDAVVLASGFDVAEYFFPIDCVGRDGCTLHDLWARDGARAYLGMTMPGMPNLFAFYGPNSQPRAGGFHQWAEAWTRYAVGAVVHLISTGADVLECRKDVYERYNAEVDKAFSTTVWATGSGGYYVNAHGRPGVHVPFENEVYYRLLRCFDPSDYRIT